MKRRAQDGREQAPRHNRAADQIHWERSTRVTLSLPVVLLFGVLAFLLIRKGGLKVSHALVAMIFGFYLASTTLATQINSLDSTIANLIDSVHP